MLVIGGELSLSCLLGQEIGESPSTSLLTVEQTGRDVELLVSVLRGIHPGYMRYRTAADVNVAEQTFLAAATDARNTGAMYLAVSKFLATIRCEHTEAEVPPQMLQWRNDHASMLPLSFAWVEGKAIVTGVGPEVTRVVVGDELIEVDGRSIRPHDLRRFSSTPFRVLKCFKLSLRGTDGLLRKTRVAAVDAEAS